MGQMTIISYGEAQPAVSGAGEAAWRLNRRAEFQVR
jgi:outer membrane protein OmpA-like peptidoglycan-associated protein